HPRPARDAGEDPGGPGRAEGGGVTSVADHRPETADDACPVLADHAPRPRRVAGGKAVAILLKEGLLDVDPLVSLDALALHGVRGGDGAVVVGAMVTHQALAEHPLVRE